MMNHRFAQSVERFQSSAVRDILKLTQGKDVISFAGGLPAEELFPLEAVRAAFYRVFQGGNGCLQYGLTEGYPPLRDAIAARLERKGIRVTRDAMLLTAKSRMTKTAMPKTTIIPSVLVTKDNAAKFYFPKSPF